MYTDRVAKVAEGGHHAVQDADDLEQRS